MVTLVQLRVIDAVRRHGSVTAAAKELHYTQPSVSHHLARLEAQLGAQLLQRVGRGIRLTAGRPPAGRPGSRDHRPGRLGDRRAVHAGRPERRSGPAGRLQLGHELTGPAGGRRPRRASIPASSSAWPTPTPRTRWQLLRAGHVDVALIFRYDDTAPEDTGIRLTHLLDDPLYLLTTGGGTTLADHKDTPWIAGCERCRSHLVELCEDAGFTPRLAYTTDDMVVMQSLVAAGMGVTTIPGLALRAHRHPAITATRLPVPSRQIYAATYGDPPDPPATAALVAALGRAAADLQADGSP